MNDMEVIKKKVLDMVEARVESIPPGELACVIHRSFGLKRKTAQSLINSLVSEGHLTYRDQHGRTIIEKSFSKPVRVSGRIILSPPEIPCNPEPKDAVVRLIHGVSFGTGHHPTTRLCLRGVDYVIRTLKMPLDTGIVLDIGTGSGVLSIAALALGIGSGIGVDIDPCARNEAFENARINGMENRFDICDVPLEEIHQKFMLITVNLRLPTLIKIYSHVDRLTDGNGAVVISGIRTDEVSDLMSFYGQSFTPFWREDEKGWASLALTPA
jgi:ribosomal protein L11 methyltransferase